MSACVENRQAPCASSHAFCRAPPPRRSAPRASRRSRRARDELSTKGKRDEAQLQGGYKVSLALLGDLPPPPFNNQEPYDTRHYQQSYVTRNPGRTRRRRPPDNRHQLRRRRPRRRRQPPSPLRLRPSAPGTPLPVPSAARRSALASPAASTGDLARRCTPLRCLRQARCLPLPHTCLPHLPTFPHRLYTSPHIHGAAPPRLSHPTAPPDPRQPYPTAPLYPLAPIRNRLHLTRSPTAQPHPTPYRGVHVDRSIATVPAPLPPPPPRKGPPRSDWTALDNHPNPLLVRLAGPERD